MDYKKILNLKNLFNERKHLIPQESYDSFFKAFSLEYTHNSTAIEGNTLTLIETKAIIEDGLSVGRKTLREIYEVVNHEKAFKYVQRSISENKDLDENTVKDIHEILMQNIINGGVYRNVDVYISGASHTPPTPNEMYRQIKTFFADMPLRNDLNEIELAAWTHAEFVRIHPFVDGNGRTARLIMNYQLMKNGYPPVSINKNDRIEYYNTLEKYAVNGNISPFADIVAGLAEEQLEKYLSLAK